MANADFVLGNWIVRPQRCCIERGDELVRIKPKSMAVLERLADANGGVVARNTLFDAVWPGGAVTDDALTQCIVELRKAFGDSPRDGRIIETIPKKGLRLVPSIEALPDAAVVSIGEVDEGEDPAPFPSLQWLTVIGLLLAVFAVSWYLSTADTGPVPFDSAAPKSIAVLPFVDMSPDGDQEYFADGMSEELINHLTKLDGLLVTGRTSSFYFKGRNEDLRSVGAQLDVNHVLEGSIRKSNEQLRITTQLVDVSNGFHLWSETYDRSLDDVFAIQDDIAASVATALSVKLGVGDIGQADGSTTNVEAFDEVMLGGAAYREFTAESMLRAIDHFRRATELDPEFGIAWERLAAIYNNAWLVFGSERADEFARKSDEALARAMQLAPNSPFVIASAAWVQLNRRQWSVVQQMLDSSREPGDEIYTKMPGVYTELLATAGQVDKAVTVKEHSLRVDPLHAGTGMYLGHLYAIQGRMDDAFIVLERGYELDDYLPQISVEALTIALGINDDRQIRHWLPRAIKHQQPGAMNINEAMAERLGDTEASLEWLRGAFEASKSTDYYVTIWASYYGDTAFALRALQRSPDPWLLWMPNLREIRRLPEFREILADIGLVDYWHEYGWGQFCRPGGGQQLECR